MVIEIQACVPYHPLMLCIHSQRGKKLHVWPLEQDCLDLFSGAVPCSFWHYLDNIPASSIVQQFCVLKRFWLCIVPQTRAWCAVFRSIKVLLDRILGYQREECLYFLNRQWNIHLWVIKKGLLVQNCCVRSFTGYVDINLSGLLCLMSQVQRCRQWQFSLANQWSAEFTSHVLLIVQFAWNLSRGGTEKSTRYQVLYPVERPEKVNHTVPYHAVEKRHMSQVVGNDKCVWLKGVFL